MAKINFYLLFDGNCEEAFTFYKSVFRNEFLSFLRYKDIPPAEGIPSVAESDRNKIENVCLSIGNETLLMGADAISDFKKRITFGNNFSIYIEAENKEEAENIFIHLSEGGTITMPFGKAHWGDYFGMLTDKFAVNWCVNFSKK